MSRKTATSGFFEGKNRMCRGNF